MTALDAILQQWVAGVMAVYSVENHCFLTGEPDRFRNPVGHLMQENLKLLLSEIFGSMDADITRGAIAAIVRIRAVQDLEEKEVAGFFSDLRPIIAALMSESDLVEINRRIDLLSLSAHEEFINCRQYLTNIRLNELRRAMAVPAAMMQARS